MNCATLLRRHAELQPGTPALIDSRRGRPRVTTFAALEQQAGKGAALLQQAGLRAGDHVLVLVPMSAELYCVLAALFRLGLVAVFLDPSAGLAHIERCCAICPPRALIASSKAHALRLVSPALRRIPLRFVIGLPLPGAIPWGRAHTLAANSDIQPCAAAAPALLTFTSGSTGTPKAAVRSHGFLLAQHAALSAGLGRESDAVDLTILPIVVLSNLAAGGSSVIPAGDLRRPAAVDPAPLVAQLQRHQVSSLTASPALLQRVVVYCRQRGLTLPQLRRVYAGGGPLLPALLDGLQALAPQAEVVAVYGSTEAEPIAAVPWGSVTPSDRQAMALGGGLLAGPPVAATELRVMRDCWGETLGALDEQAFAARCCPVGQPGEIVVNGRHVLAGYLHGAGDSESKLRVGGAIWHRTGDAGYLDAAGRLWLLGRCAARVDDQHGRIYPFAVEAAVGQLPGVGRAALMGLHGRRVVAVEPAAPEVRLDAEALRRAVAWAGIDAVRVCSSLPVDARHNAKVDYAALRRALER